MEKPIVHLAITCDYVIVGENNKLSAIGMFDRFLVDTVPMEFPMPRFYFISRISLPKTDTDYTQQIEIICEQDNKSISKSKVATMRAKNKDEKIGLLTEFSDVSFNSVGKHYFIIRLNSEEIHRVPILVEYANK